MSAREGKSSRPAADATPGLTDRQEQAEAPADRPAPSWPADWDHVLDTAIRAWGGEWDTVRVQRLFLARYSREIGRSPARAFLSRRAHQGVMQLHERPNSRFYTLRKDVRP